MISSLMAAFSDANGQPLGVVGNDLNMRVFSVMNETGLVLSNSFYYFIIDRNMQVLWHSLRDYSNVSYSLVQIEFLQQWPPVNNSVKIDNPETQAFMKLVQSDISP